MTEIYRTLPEQIAARLRQQVLSGDLKPNDPLREIEVSEQFGVSRGPVREALRQLTQQGLLVLEPNKGVRVAPKPDASVRPLVVELRRTIEKFILEQHFEQITEAQIEELGAILADILDACESGNTDALTEHDIHFHKALVTSYGNKNIVEMWEPIMMRMMMHYSRLGDLMESYEEHKRIFDAIRAGDKAAALAALEANIQ